VIQGHNELDEVIVPEIFVAQGVGREGMAEPRRSPATARNLRRLGGPLSRLLVPRGKMKPKAAEVNREGRPCQSRPLGRKLSE
jgi:hypothetical protein